MGRVLRVVLAFALGLLVLAGHGVPVASAADPTADLQIEKAVSAPVDDELGGTGSPLPRPLIWAAGGAVLAGLVLVIASRRRRRRA